MQRRIEQADRDGQSAHCSQDPLEVALLHRRKLVQRGEALVLITREDHATHGREPLLAHKHVLGATQADPLGTEASGSLGVFGCVGIGADAQGADLVGPPGQTLEVLVEARRYERHGSGKDFACRAVHGDCLAFGQRAATNRDRSTLSVNLETFNARHARLAHAARDNCRMRGHTAMCSQNALGDDHAVDVVGRRLPAHEDDGQAGLATALCGIRIEHDLANARTR